MRLIFVYLHGVNEIFTPANNVIICRSKITSRQKK